MKTLLIVDDDPMACQWCAEELEGDGYRVIRSFHGGEVMDLIRGHHPDLVILDIRLGEYNGLDLLQEIRNAQYDLPVILYSAYASFKQDLRSIAADYYVVKSADLHELKEKVERSFEGMRTYGPPAMPQSDQKVGHHGLQLHDYDRAQTQKY